MWESTMVLTPSQRDELINAVADFLKSSGFKDAYECLLREANVVRLSLACPPSPSLSPASFPPMTVCVSDASQPSLPACV